MRVEGPSTPNPDFANGLLPEGWDAVSYRGDPCPTRDLEFHKC